MKTTILAGLLACGLAVGVPHVARANFIDGHSLYLWCSTPATDPMYARYDASCRTFILGVHDGLDLAGYVVTLARDEAAASETNATGDREVGIRFLCVTDEADVSRLRALVLAFFEEYPEERDKPASASVLAALYPEYPCR